MSQEFPTTYSELEMQNNRSTHSRLFDILKRSPNILANGGAKIYGQPDTLGRFILVATYPHSLEARATANPPLITKPVVVMQFVGGFSNDDSTCSTPYGPLEDGDVVYGTTKGNFFSFSNSFLFDKEGRAYKHEDVKDVSHIHLPTTKLNFLDFQANENDSRYVKLSDNDYEKIGSALILIEQGRLKEAVFVEPNNDSGEESEIEENL